MWIDPTKVISKAVVMRREHYESKGTKPLRWFQLSDAQKVEWIVKAYEELLDMECHI